MTETALARRSAESSEAAAAPATTYGDADSTIDEASTHAVRIASAHDVKRSAASAGGHRQAAAIAAMAATVQTVGACRDGVPGGPAARVGKVSLPIAVSSPAEHRSAF